MGVFLFVFVLAAVGAGVWAALNKEQATQIVNDLVNKVNGGGAQCTASTRGGSSCVVNTARSASLRTAVQ
ncbi:hypothetical protein AAVH_04178 [Aphelenchoides avenae]|nr:hypothetical protein AAVH_04178 [Aphelenchus avenae]